MFVWNQVTESKNKMLTSILGVKRFVKFVYTL